MAISVKNRQFLQLCVFDVLKGFQLELGTDTRGNKIRMMGLPDGQNSFKIDLAISTQYQRVTDRRQDILR